MLPTEYLLRQLRLLFRGWFYSKQARMLLAAVRCFRTLICLPQNSASHREILMILGCRGNARPNRDVKT
jgi:hypothetical protein